MTDTVRTREELKALFPLGIRGGITGQALRDFLASTLLLSETQQFLTAANSDARRAMSLNVGDFVQQTNNGRLYLLRAAPATNSANWYDFGVIRADDEVAPPVPATYFTYKGNGEGFLGYMAVEIPKSNVPTEPIIAAFEAQWTNAMGAMSDDYEWASASITEVTSDTNNWYLTLGSNTLFIPEFTQNATVRIRYSDPQGDWAYLRSHVIFSMPGESPEGVATMEEVLAIFRDQDHISGTAVFTLGDPDDISFGNHIFVDDVLLITEFYPNDHNIYGALDLSGCTNLDYIDISYSGWTQVCVSGCSSLLDFWCSNCPLLTSLDFSYLEALGRIDCAYNSSLASILATGYTGSGGKARVSLSSCNLEAEGLDAFFSSLGNYDTDNSKNEIEVDDNPGSPTCDPTIATDKGWYVAGAYGLLAAPQNAQGSQTNDQLQVILTWNAVENADHYQIERGTGSGYSDYAYNIADTTFTDDSVSGGVTYHYWILPQSNSDRWHTGDWSSEVIVPVESIIPILAMPQNPIATQTDLTEVTFVWDAVANATDYTVTRQRWDGGAWVEQSVLIVYTNSFVGSVITPNKYAYFVQANAVGYISGDSNGIEITVTTTLPLATPVPTVEQTGAAEITITWSAIPHAASYFIGRNSGDGWVRPFATGITSPYVDTNDIGVGRTYTYILSAVGDSGYVDSESSQIGVTIT